MTTGKIGGGERGKLRIPGYPDRGIMCQVTHRNVSFLTSRSHTSVTGIAVGEDSFWCCTILTFSEVVGNSSRGKRTWTGVKTKVSRS